MILSTALVHRLREDIILNPFQDNEIRPIQRMSNYYITLTSTVVDASLYTQLLILSVDNVQYSIFYKV